MKKGYLEKTLGWYPPAKRKKGKFQNPLVQNITEMRARERTTWTRWTRKNGKGK